jgi:hypothetical protein
MKNHLLSWRKNCKITLTGNPWKALHYITSRGPQNLLARGHISISYLMKAVFLALKSSAQLRSQTIMLKFAT